MGKTKPKPLRKISAEEFARRLRMITKETDKRLAVFLGAGCSVSSGIPAAGDLVKGQWLPRLRDFCEPECKDLDTWAKDQFPDYDPKNPATLYGALMERLFLYPDDRQREIENLCDGRFPGFGYAALASLVAMKDGHLNVVLTTNFDDLIADALFLFSRARPLVIHHEFLASYIRPTRTRPLVVKLHGDYRLSPQNTAEETDTLKRNIESNVRLLLHDLGLIFIGYGGNDVGIKKMLEGMPKEGLPPGVFWVSREEPQGIIQPWLESRNAIWVEKGDFDELMLLVRNEFNLPHPDRARFDDVFGKYFATYDTLSSRIVKLPSTAPDASAMKEAVKRADESFPDWWAVAVKAERLKDTDPDQANAIYARGSEQFPQSALLLGYYAVFLAAVRQDYDGADKYFRRALEVDPSQEAILTNYAFFLYRCRKDYDGAEQRYRRALEINPNDALILSSYALFLAGARKDYGAAEEHFRRALEVNPNQEASSLGTYAFFLYVYHKDYDAAEEYFRRALAVDPNHTNNLGYYATFLYLVRKDYDRAEEHFRRALAADPNNANNFGNYAGLLLAQGKGPEGLSVLDRALALAPGSGTPGLAAECWFYAFAHRPAKERGEALRNLKRVLEEGGWSPDWDLSPNIAQARKDGHPDAVWLEKLAAVISDGADIKTLDTWPRWKKA